jgi:hypothetical protein
MKPSNEMKEREERERDKVTKEIFSKRFLEEIAKLKI